MSRDGQWMMCMTCGNAKEGANIYKCPNCGHFYCDACKDTDWAGDHKCPKCGDTIGMFGSHKVGEIKR